MAEIKRKIAAGVPANVNGEDDYEDDIVIDLWIYKVKWV